MGMKAAYLAAFKEEVKANVSDGYLVGLEKEITNDRRETLIAAQKKYVGEFLGASYESLSKEAIEKAVQQITINNMSKPFVTHRTGDEWVSIVDPRRSESKLRVCAITDQNKYEIDHQAYLLRKGTLFPVDRFFAQIRRRVAMFERPISSGANGRKVWYAKQPYNPAMYQKIGDIYRVYYNYCKEFKKRKGETPATRLGLAKGVICLEDIIYHSKYR